MSPLPPDQEPPRDEPELEPEFREALREAAGEATPGKDEPAGAAEAAPDEEAAAAEPAGEAEPEAPAEAPAAPEADEAPDPAEAADPDEAEAAEAPEAPEPAGEPEPEEQPTAEKPVRRVVIGAGRATTAAERVGVRAGAPPKGPSAEPAPAEAQPEPKRPRLWLRFVLASSLIVVSMAAATSVSLLLWVGDLAAKLRANNLEGVENILDDIEAGDPQTILILGSDKRVAQDAEDYKGLSDTTMLLRIDPDKVGLAVMSIPRDLKVFIPGVGTNKFNAAYAFGGPKLTLRTVQRLMPGLDINHLVNVDFLGFARAVDAIDCVWVDVDRRYYHSNVGLPASMHYAEINVKSGYQQMCGFRALEYVRYRHADTDLVRSARQQDFLREARQRVPATRVWTDRGELLDIFTTYTTSDIDDPRAMIEVMKLFIEARNAPIKEVHFPARLGRSYVFSSRFQIEKAIDEFLGLEASGGPRGVLERPEDEPEVARPKPPKKSRPGVPEDDGLVDARFGSRDVAKGIQRKGIRWPLFFPTRLPSGAIYSEAPRVYHLIDTDENPHSAYRLVIQTAQGEYFGVQGIRDWGDPPILNNPSETRIINGREYDIYYAADRIRRIAWHRGDNSYWVSNTLLQSLTNDQMVGLVRSSTFLKPKKRKKR